MWPFKKKEPEKKKDTYPKTVYNADINGKWIGGLEKNPLDEEFTKTYQFRGVYDFNKSINPLYYYRGGVMYINRACVGYVESETVDALAEYEYEKD